MQMLYIYIYAYILDMYIKITISLFSYFILMHYKLHYELKNAPQKFQLLQFAIVNFKERERDRDDAFINAFRDLFV